MANRCDLLWDELKKKSIAAKKQDGQGARTPADLERKYDIESISEDAKDTLSTTEETLKVVGQLVETQDGLVLVVADLNSNLLQTRAELSLKVGRTENNQIVSMLNAAADIITLNSNRLIVNSDNFELSADGAIKCKSADIGGWKVSPTDGSKGLKDVNTYKIGNVQYEETTHITGAGIHTTVKEAGLTIYDKTVSWYTLLKSITG